MPTRTSTNLLKEVLFWLAVALAFLVMMFPLYWMLNVSLQSSGSAVGTPWIPLELSFDGYATALREQGRNLVTSLVVAVGSVLVSLLIATPAAYALAQFRVRGAGVVLFAILISQMIPGIVVANALYDLYSDVGLLNSVPGLILADSTHGIPFAILIMRAFLTSIPGEVIEAALRVAGHRRPVLPGPAPLLKLGAAPLTMLASPPLTPDAIDFINQPATVDLGPLLERMPRRLTPLEEGLASYLAPGSGPATLSIEAA